jgi:hypothetical protein
MGGAHTKSAGTAEIARDSGGDSMSVNDAEALAETLARLRQRYTLYFNLPEGAQPGEESNIQVDLSPDVRRRFPDAEVRYRRTSMSNSDSRGAGPTKVTRAPRDSGLSDSSDSPADSSAPTVHRRRVAVNEDGTPVASPDQQ